MFAGALLLMKERLSGDQTTTSVARQRIGHQSAREHIARIQKNIWMVLFDNCGDHGQTAGAVFRKYVTMNVIRMHQDDINLRRCREGDGGKEQCRRDEQRLHCA